MTTSERDRAFVWFWLPAASEPVVAGALDREGAILTFTYGRSYLERGDAIPLYLPELPLRRGPIRPQVGEAAGCIVDAGPDSWGRRVILNRRFGGAVQDTTALDLLSYLMESGSDRTGALDFQASSSEYVARFEDGATLDPRVEAAQRVEQGQPLPAALEAALLRGTTIGGARPKAQLRDAGRELIAKFASTTDVYAVVKGEFVAMELARRAGLDVAAVELTSALGKDVLLVERFDRTGGGRRRAVVSALTVLGLDELGGRYASYADLAHVVRTRFTAPGATLRELFARIVFNVLAGNTDDHARNQAAFWDGDALTLTPAYDICPIVRAGGEARQAMAIGDDGYRMSQVAGCVARASTYHLSEQEAREIVDAQIDVIETQWEDVCDRAGLSEVDRALLRRGAFLTPYALEGWTRVA